MEQTKDRKQIRAELDAAGFKNTWVWVLCMLISAAVLIGISLLQRYKDISKNREYSYGDAILIEHNQQKTYRWRKQGSNTTTRTYIKVAYTPEGSDKHYENPTGLKPKKKQKNIKQQSKIGRAHV